MTPKNPEEAKNDPLRCESPKRRYPKKWHEPVYILKLPLLVTLLSSMVD